MVKNNSFYLRKEGILVETHIRKAVFEKLARDLIVPHSNKKRKIVQEGAIRHSVEMELEGGSRVNRRADRRRYQKNLRKALEWAVAEYNPSLTSSYILGVGELIEPEVNELGYRVDPVRLNTRDGVYIAPSPEKIEPEIEAFLLENSCLDDPLERAIHAHFHIARIHPFEDGNGRTSRLIQNVILEKEGFFPSLIRNSERREYHDFLSEAVYSYRKAASRLADSSREYSEFNELVVKANLSLKEIRRCKDLSIYLARKKMTLECNKFYDFIASTILDAFNTEIKKLKRREYELYGSRNYRSFKKYKEGSKR